LKKPEAKLRFHTNPNFPTQTLLFSQLLKSLIF
jgi:hypothetical protein